MSVVHILDALSEEYISFLEHPGFQSTEHSMYLYTSSYQCGSLGFIVMLSLV